MAADGLGAPATADGWSAAWDEAVARDPGAAAAREQAERDAAAHAAKVEQLTVGGVIDDVLEVILQAEADGVPMKEIQAFLADYLQGRWGDAASPLLRTIFRTNVQSAFNSVRYTRMNGDATRPFWQFAAILDESTTMGCQRCDGTTLASDDTWWATHWPPLHHHCRSTVLPLTPEELEAVGGITERPPVNATVAAEGFGLTPDGAFVDLEIEDP